MHCNKARQWQSLLASVLTNLPLLEEVGNLNLDEDLIDGRGRRNRRYRDGCRRGRLEVRGGVGGKTLQDFVEKRGAVRGIRRQV